MTSPFGVLISSPTMIRTPRSRSVAVTAADVTLWSVTQTTSRAVCRARSASCSSVSTESPDAAVCRWQSTRTRPPGAREPETGRSTETSIGTWASLLPGSDIIETYSNIVQL